LSEAELRMLVSRSTQQGQIEEGEQEMIDKVFVFGDKDAASVMVARPDVVALSVDMPAEEAVAAVLESPYTRYPVFRETLDDIVGVLHVRDLFAAMADRGLQGLHLGELLRPAYIVPETKDLASLLQDFRRRATTSRSSSTSMARWSASARSRT
jgi:Hemolysins and related proteins containing CBS domains